MRAYTLPVNIEVTYEAEDFASAQQAHTAFERRLVEFALSNAPWAINHLTAHAVRDEESIQWIYQAS